MLVLSPTETEKFQAQWIGPFERSEEDQPYINENLTEEQNRQITQLLHETSSVFSSEPGYTDLVEHSIPTGDAVPVYQPAYRIPAAWQDRVRKEI